MSRIALLWTASSIDKMTKLSAPVNSHGTESGIDNSDKDPNFVPNSSDDEVDQAYFNPDVPVIPPHNMASDAGGNRNDVGEGTVKGRKRVRNESNWARTAAKNARLRGSPYSRQSEKKRKMIEDTCYDCYYYIEALKETNSEDEKEKMKKEQLNHHQEAELRYKLKRNDKVKKENPGILYYKTSFNESDFKSVNFKRRVRFPIIFPDTIPAIRSTTIPIKLEKYQHLQTLLTWVDNSFHTYYKSLKYLTTAPDQLIDDDDDESDE
nr:unnamed protein product [Callosobruchus chinensis]